MGDWTTWLILAGRGFGKTKTGSEWVRALAESGEVGRIAIVAEDAGDARDVMIEGESGILGCCPPWFRPKWNPSNKRLTWPNGCIATTYSSDDPESLRGPQFEAAWIDELAKYRYAEDTWDNLQFGLRLGKNPRQIVTTTPRPIKTLKEIIADKGTTIVRGSTYDNRANLSAKFFSGIITKYEGTRLGRQELHAALLDDNPNALWNHSIIEQHRAKKVDKATLRRIVVAVDPPGSAEGAECGIVVAGISRDNHITVLADCTVSGRQPNGPGGWAEKIIKAATLWDAECIVAEVNFGGDMVRAVIRNEDKNARVLCVRARRGKWLRAEPIAGLYEQGRVHHLGVLAALEDQMCQFDVTQTADGESPDRLDALVYACTLLAYGEGDEGLGIAQQVGKAS